MSDLSIQPAIPVLINLIYISRGAMEQPPAVPPPPPDHSAASAATSNSKLYTILAWVLAPPIGSFVMIFVAGRTEPEARFNAANATAVHGVMLAVSIVLQILSSAIGFFFVFIWLWNLIWFAIWVYGILLAVQSEGQRFRFPVVTDTLAGFITSLENLGQ
jgi:uncharacterized membrane protein